MNQPKEKLNKYFRVKPEKEVWKSSYLDKKKGISYKVSDKELAENLFYWDPTIRQFIRSRR